MSDETGPGKILRGSVRVYGVFCSIREGFPELG